MAIASARDLPYNILLANQQLIMLIMETARIQPSRPTSCRSEATPSFRALDVTCDHDIHGLSNPKNRAQNQGLEQCR